MTWKFFSIKIVKVFWANASLCFEEDDHAKDFATFLGEDEEFVKVVQDSMSTTGINSTVNYTYFGRENNLISYDMVGYERIRNKGGDLWQGKSHESLL